MVGMDQSCRGSIVVFKESNSCSLWRLGIICGIFYERFSFPVDVLHVYQWNGDLCMFQSPDWQSMQHFFTLKCLDLSGVEMFFVNQVSMCSCANLFFSLFNLTSHLFLR